MEKAKAKKTAKTDKKEVFYTPPEKTVDIASLDRISFFTRDQEGSIYGKVSISRTCILDVTYDGIKNEMAVTMVARAMRGFTSVEPIQNVKVVNGKKEPVKNAYTVRELFNVDGYQHTLILNDEEEMKNLWIWLGHEVSDCPFAKLMEIRDDMLKRFEEAKLAAKLRDAENLEKQEKEATTGKILGLDGKELKSEK